MDRKIDLIVVHCSATSPYLDIGADEIREWHTAKGWKDIGYHNVIRRDGTLEHGRDLRVAGAHAKGFNKNSIGICLVGGVNFEGESENNFDEKQLKTLRGYLDTMLEIFPNATVKGHKDLPNVAKDCPCFDVRKWYRS